MTNALTELFSAAKESWINNWFGSFSSPNRGFHERLDSNNQPIDMPRRLLTQCRQIIVYSLALKDNPNLNTFREKLDDTFNFVKETYFNPKTGGSIFSINSDNEPEDTKYDLYGHAFIMLACAAYYNATRNEEALEYAKTTFNFINKKFTLSDQPGLAEALDDDLNPIPEKRRQNPHMHLMEACIYMYEASDDKAYLQGAEKMLELFYDKLLDSQTQTLGEFFGDDLGQHPDEGHLVEAGHHAEWVWLLKRYQEVSGSTDSRLNETMNALFSWVKTHGIDPENSGVFNIQDREGSIIDSNKRIWPNLETIRAASIMVDSPEHGDDARKIVANLTGTIKEHYINATTGDWTEVLDLNMQPVTDYRPGTTPYHIFPVLRETNEYLRPSADI